MEFPIFVRRDLAKVTQEEERQKYFVLHNTEHAVAEAHRKMTFPLVYMSNYVIWLMITAIQL